MKPLFLISAPVSSRSGYGDHSRDLVRVLIESGRYDVKLNDLRWGGCPRNHLKEDNPDHRIFLDRILSEPKLPRQPDIYMNVSVPNEFQPVGKFNIGCSAGIETTIASQPWIEGLNRMDLIIVPSNHAKNVFQSSVWKKHDNQTKQLVAEYKLEKPIEVLFEGARTEIFKSIPHKQMPAAIVEEFKQIQENFCFLFVGHWLNGAMGQDRKDCGMLIKVFLESFKNMKNPPALIMKTSSASFSVMDREEMLQKITGIKRSIQADILPNIYLLHGELTDEEMNGLYNYSKVKAHISFTKGEGFCVLPHTKIITNTGLERIDEIKFGERVLTHTNKFLPVTNLLNRYYSGKLVNIETYNGCNFESESFTPNHQFRIYNEIKFDWKSAGDISLNDKLVFPIIDINIHKEICLFDFIDNTNIKLCDDYLEYVHSDKKSHRIKNTIKLNADFGKLIGYYLSEGSLNENCGIDFSLHSSEENTIGQEIINSFKSVFGINCASIRRHSFKKRIIIHFYSVIVNNFLYNFCGKLAHKKFINDIILNSHHLFKLNIISSLLNGDGSIHSDSIGIQLVNDNIIRNLRLMLLSNEIISNYDYQDRIEKTKHKEIKHKHLCHRIRICQRSSLNRLIDIINENHSYCNIIKKQNKRINYEGGRSSFIKTINNKKYLIVKIKSIQYENYNGIVHNLSVETDESYCTENFVVHNCRPLLEASLSGKPVIAPGWSGQADFLNKGLSLHLPGTLTNVHDSASWENVILKESKWFTVNYNYASQLMRDVYRNYKKYTLNAKKQAMMNTSQFSFKKMCTQFLDILDRYVPEMPTQVTGLNLPALPTMTKVSDTPQITLPKLKGLDDIEAPEQGSGQPVTDEVTAATVQVPSIIIPKLPNMDVEETKKDEVEKVEEINEPVE